jgi:GT2 family glycosyltransferase
MLVAIPTLSRADLLIRNKVFLESVMAPDEVLILDNGKQSIKMNVPIERSAENLGVSGSWNLFLRRAFQERNFDGLILLQDDIIWSRLHLDRAKRLVEKHEDIDLFLAFHQFSVQIHRPRNIETIGFYDEQFRPGYCEDDDYAIRMILGRRIYHRFHELDPMHGSQIEGTPKAVPGTVQKVKLIKKWGVNRAIGINEVGKPWYITNKTFNF